MRSLKIVKIQRRCIVLSTRLRFRPVGVAYMIERRWNTSALLLLLALYKFLCVYTYTESVRFDRFSESTSRVRSCAGRLRDGCYHTSCGALQRIAAHCSALRRIVAHCGALRRIAAHCSALWRILKFYIQSLRNLCARSIILLTNSGTGLKSQLFEAGQILFLFFHDYRTARRKTLNSSRCSATVNAVLSKGVID